MALGGGRESWEAIPEPQRRSRLREALRQPGWKAAQSCLRFAADLWTEVVGSGCHRAGGCLDRADAATQEKLERWLRAWKGNPRHPAEGFLRPRVLDDKPPWLDGWRAGAADQGEHLALESFNRPLEKDEHMSERGTQHCHQANAQ